MTASTSEATPPQRLTFDSEDIASDDRFEAYHALYRGSTDVVNNAAPNSAAKKYDFNMLSPSARHCAIFVHMPIARHFNIYSYTAGPEMRV